MGKLSNSLGKARWPLAVSAALFLLLAIFLVVRSQTDDDSFLNNILVFALVNLNVMALLVLIFMVGRNVVKLIFERRRGILGAKLRARLVGAFVLLACVPMTFSFIVSSGLINEAMESWFDTQIDSAVTGAVTIARQHIAGVKNSIRAASGRIDKELARRPELRDKPEVLQLELEELRQLNDLFSVRVVARDGRVLVESAHPTAAVESFKEPKLDNEVLRRAARGESLLRIEELGAGQFIRSYTPLGRFVLVTAHRMDPEIVQAQIAVNESFSEFEQLKLFKHPLKTNFLLTLLLFNLLSLFGAIWAAFFVAKQITGPILMLAEGANKVAQGKFDFEVDPIRDDEIGMLVGSFNGMVRELGASRDIAERRGLLIETILANLAVGVIALDTEKRVTTVNSAAASLLQINHVHLEPALPLSELLCSEDYERIGPLLAALDGEEGARAQHVTETELRLSSGGSQLIVVCTAGRIVGGESGSLGYVLLFDDVTEISRSQHLAAWRDVARRIAHEIKNPLTPIQLSAQRLEKLLGGTEQSETVSECARAIVEHVAIIKRLANEFSEYGRMPTARFAPADLAGILSFTVAGCKAENPDVDISLDIQGKLPEMLLDAEQIRGVILNLLNNAVAAVQSLDGQRRVEVRASFERYSGRASVEVADNGPGIVAADKNRVFEPYFTTKKGGTGLGLAIVSSVISDHQGEVRIFDNVPRGARFVVSLPQHPQPSTLRKLVTT